MTSPTSTTLDGLPKQFVSAMRTLFDIMDDKHTGSVSLADIEQRWQDDGSKGLPKGVLESLRKVTPANGQLSFERFCAGLKICLLRNQVEHRITTNTVTSPNNRPPSAPLLDLESPTTTTTNWINKAAIRPNNNIVIPQRTISMPQLLMEQQQQQHQKENADNNNGFGEKPVPSKPCMLYGPPKPPRVGLNTNTNIDRAEIRTALQNWQIGIMMNDQERYYNGNVLRNGRSLGDGKATTDPANQTTTGLYQKKSNVTRNRREPRRHTLQNGIDFNMLKRMKQIEQEKDFLMQGLSAVEKAREWYLKQVAAVQERMKYLGRMGHVEPWSEAQQEKLELQRARVLEVNRHLAALTDSWERGGLPLHMNLAIQHHHQYNLSSRIKEQNHLLTEEVGKKSERITILEREKASLIRELIQLRNRNNIQEEAVF